MDSRQYVSQTPNIHVGPAVSPPSGIPPLQTSSAKRRRTSTTGSRGVANLSPEQLAKKRANDREAQRAIRERTKGQIESLERRIKELTAQKPYQELQHAIRQKDIVEAENEEIKRRLVSIQSLIQPLLATNSTAGPPPVYAANDFRTQRGPQPPPIAASASTYNDTSSIRSSVSTASTYTASPQAPRQTPPISQANFPPQSTGFSPVNNFSQRQNSLHHTLPNRLQDDRLDLGYLLQSGPNGGDRSQSMGRKRTTPGSPSSVLPMHTLSPVPGATNIAARGNETPAHAVPVRNIPPTCPLDGLLLEFLADRRQQALEGVPTQELVGPPYPSFSTLINAQRKQYSHPLSKIFTDMMGTFPDISTLPEQVAILYVMFLIMRWQIGPTQENYERLPDWVTPRAPQLFHPHPAWIDHLPWPRMRDKMVRIYPSVPFDEFFIPYTTTVSVNWPYDSRDVLRPTPGTDELSINPIFEAHLRDLNNWSLGPAFAKAHPPLADTARIKPEVEMGKTS
ncbi:MAG: hypothetical protein Q9217_003277 [Psora testacea]